MRRGLSVVRDLWVAVGILVLLLTAIEVLPDAWKSFWRGIKYESEERPDYRVNAESLQDVPWAEAYFREANNDLATTWRPYVHWRQSPLAGNYFSIDSRGIRKTWIDPASNANTRKIRIFMFGGSTLMGIGARDDQTIPSLLAKALASTPYHVEVINFGIVGYVSTQETFGLIEELKDGNQPDIVIFYDGVNDAFAAQQSGFAGPPHNIGNRIREYNLLNRTRRADLWQEFMSIVLRRTIRRAQNAAAALGLIARPPESGVPARDVQALADSVVDRYAHNIRIVRNLGEQYGFESLFFWQPVIFSKNRLTPHEARYRDAQASGELFRAIYESRKSNTILAAMPGAIDISDILDGRSDNIYFDFAHVNEAGNELIARAMLPKVRETLSEIVSKQN